MCQCGFTHRKLRDIFSLDPDQPEDRSAIAALRASPTRQHDRYRSATAQRNVRDVFQQLLTSARQVAE
jgi:hypothetical protein